MISTLFGIIIFSFLPQFFDLGEITFIKSSSLYSKNIKNPITGDLESAKHNSEIVMELNLADSLLNINQSEENLDVITTAEMLFTEDSTKGDFIALRGLAYFQRGKLTNKSKKLVEQAKNDLLIAIKSKNINVKFLVKSLITLSDIYLFENDLKNADRMIKNALRANKYFPGIRERLKNINKMKLQ